MNCKVFHWILWRVEISWANSISNIISDRRQCTDSACLKLPDYCTMTRVKQETFGPNIARHPQQLTGTHAHMRPVAWALFPIFPGTTNLSADLESVPESRSLIASRHSGRLVLVGYYVADP